MPFSLQETLQSYDFFQKAVDHSRIKTLSGAAISILSAIFIAILTLSEIAGYLSTDTRHELVVDDTRGGILRINVNVTFHRLPCSMLSLDAMDISGEHQLDLLHNIFKQRLDKHGVAIAPAERELDLHSNKTLTRDHMKDVVKSTTHGKNGHTPDTGRQRNDADKHGQVVENPSNPTAAGKCGSCYGAEENPGDCCNTCAEVREAYRKRGWAFAYSAHIVQCAREGEESQHQQDDGEGCLMAGHLEVNKVAGNFHFAPGKSFQQGGMHVHDLMSIRSTSFNISHTINGLSFGKYFPGRINPLDGTRYITAEIGSSMYQYFVKVVPTSYMFANGRELSTHQFSVTEHVRKLDGVSSRGLPGVFFFYDLSPIKVNVKENSKPFLHFLTQVCAIVGGVFTVAGILDALVFSGTKLVKKRLGKLS